MATSEPSSKRPRKHDTLYDERSLLTIIVDVTPESWGEREMERAENDKKRQTDKRRISVGPATMNECMNAVRAFCGAYDSLSRDAVLVVMAVAGNDSSLIYPQKEELHRFFTEGGKVDIRKLQENFTLGVADLVQRSSLKVKERFEKMSSADKVNSAEDVVTGGEKKGQKPSEFGNAGMAAALSRALALINRFLVAAGTGVSALAADSSAMWNRQDDEGVLSLLGGKKRRRGRSGSVWSPRVLMIQASEDRTQDYNAFMNCAFAASKQNISLDGCYLRRGEDTSHFLEQAVDLTEGVYLAPSGPSQVGGCLTEVLLAVFLAPRSVRPDLNLPALNKVDFRARCFETGESVDIAHVCNQCLSIFKNKPKQYCPTCGSEIRKAAESSDDKKRIESTDWKG
mmetsp:Transcript_8122/g.11704  ORF Transcript_8122/g.11704 Transcript_8122/m.11704 type:complete len:398 (-) Transcript_8122:204-1397(-)